MARALVFAYVAAILAEIVGLGAAYALRPPASSSLFNVALGWIGLISMVVMLIYSVARRSQALRRVARLSAWLHFHIFLGVQGMVLILFHSSHLLRGEGFYLLNPGMLNFVALSTVFASGLFGRYLYAWLPRTIGGEQMALKQVEAELAGAAEPLPEEVVNLWKNAPEVRSPLGLVQADLATRRAIRKLGRMKLAPDVLAMARRRVLLERKRRALLWAQRIFSTWIFLHRPIAALMYILTAVHVGVALLFSTERSLW